MVSAPQHPDPHMGTPCFYMCIYHTFIPLPLSTGFVLHRPRLCLSERAQTHIHTPTCWHLHTHQTGAFFFFFNVGRQSSLIWLNR